MSNFFPKTLFGLGTSLDVFDSGEHIVITYYIHHLLDTIVEYPSNQKVKRHGGQETLHM